MRHRGTAVETEVEELMEILKVPFLPDKDIVPSDSQAGNYLHMESWATTMTSMTSMTSMTGLFLSLCCFYFSVATFAQAILLTQTGVLQAPEDSATNGTDPSARTLQGTVRWR